MTELTKGNEAVLWYALAAYVKAIGMDYDAYLALLRHIETSPAPADPVAAWFSLDSATIESGIETS